METKTFEKVSFYMLYLIQEGRNLEWILKLTWRN